MSETTEKVELALVDERLRGAAPLLGAYMLRAYEQGTSVGVSVEDYVRLLRKLRGQIDAFLDAVEPAPARSPEGDVGELSDIKICARRLAGGNDASHDLEAIERLADIVGARLARLETYREETVDAFQRERSRVVLALAELPGEPPTSEDELPNRVRQMREALEAAERERERLEGQIVKAADALAKGDTDEAYHQLYAAADPTFTEPHSPFDKWRRRLAEGDGG